MSAVTYTDEQTMAIGELHNGMGGLICAAIACRDSGLPLADAFVAIGMEVPLFLHPMLNQLADKLPTMEPLPEL